MSDQPFVMLLNDSATYTLHVVPHADALAHLAAEATLFWASKAIQRRGVFHWALSGGTTPRTLYQLLAQPAFAARFDWSRVHVWWSDERAVPPDHPESNFRLAHEALLSHVPIPTEQMHRVRTELGAVEAAQAYEQTMRTTMGLASEVGLPRFDLILLGMGEDGHTASLFPYTPALEARDRWVVANPVPKLGAMRITFTFPLINAADAVIFLVSGASKATTLRDVLVGPLDVQRLPAQGVMPPNGKLQWIVDRAAAAQVAPAPAYPKQEVIYRRVG